MLLYEVAFCLPLHNSVQWNSSFEEPTVTIRRLDTWSIVLLILVGDLSDYGGNRELCQCEVSYIYIHAYRRIRLAKTTLALLAGVPRRHVFNNVVNNQFYTTESFLTPLSPGPHPPPPPGSHRTYILPWAVLLATSTQ